MDATLSRDGPGVREGERANGGYEIQRATILQVLGPVSASCDDERIAVGPRLQRLLAALVIDLGSTVSADRLVDIVWAGDPPPGAEGTLRSYVTRLRQTLGDDGDLIVRRGVGYVLRADTPIDAIEFEQELDGGLAHLRTGDLGMAERLIASALERWHGRAFGELADEPWALPEAARLEERLLEAREARIDLMLADGRAEAAVAFARALANEQPLRERPCELLMRALSANGRQADALRAFTDHRRRLAEETGLTPTAQLEELERQILLGDVSRMSRTGLRGYELGERIGSGAHAVVRRAIQTGVGREVAVKIIRPELADSPEFVRRFEHEARLVARVEHPNVVPLYDFWREPGAAYLVMRYLRGGSLAGRLAASGPSSAADVLRLLDQIGGALSEAHRVGVAHRDIRPQNLLLDHEGVNYLADFGIGMSLPFGSPLDESAWVVPAYAAPERLRGEPGGVTADVMSLALTVYEMLTGRLPFADSDDRAELIDRQLSEPIPRVTAIRSDLPSVVDDVLAVATAKAPADRHPTVDAFVDDLSTALRRETSAPRRPVPPVLNPYVGLHPFDEADADRFVGREVLVDEVLHGLRTERLVVLVGPSGSGKSSAVGAGVVPAIRAGAVPGSEKWFVTSMTPGLSPIDALETALLRVALNPPTSLRVQLSEDGGLLRAFRRVLPDHGGQILLVVDQFEELFVQTEPTLRRRFLDELAHAVSSPDSPLRVVATLRADHFDAPLQHAAMADLVRRGTVTVRPMTPAELERVIVVPARRVAVEVEPPLVAELVAGVNSAPSSLPLLQVALTELFERRVGEIMLHSVHHELGGLTGSIASRAERILDRADPDDVRAVRRMFGRLVDVGHSDTRRRAPISEVADDERSIWLLDAFVRARLLTTDVDPATRAPTVEVAHEAMLRSWPRLRDWIEEDRADLAVRSTLSQRADAWFAAARDPGELARGNLLEVARDLGHRRPDLLTPQEREWVVASATEEQRAADEAAAASERERRRGLQLQRLLIAAAVLLLAAIAAASVALVLRARATDTARAAHVDRLIALSASEIADEPDRAVLLALEAHRRDPGPATLSAVHRAIASEPRIVSIYDPPIDGQSFARVSADGTTGLTHGSIDGSPGAQFFDARTGAALGGPISFDVPTVDVAVSGDGSTGAVGLVDNTIAFVDRATDGINVVYDAGEVYGVALDGRGRTAVVEHDGRVALLDVSSGDEIGTYAHDAALTRVAMADDGATLAVALVEQESLTIEILETATMSVLRRFDAHPSTVGSFVLTDDDHIVLGQQDGVVRVYAADGSTPATELRGHTQPVTSVAVNEGGQIVSAATDNTVRRWQPGSLVAESTFEWEGFVDSLSLTDDGIATVVAIDRPVVVLAPDASLFVTERLPADGLSYVSSDRPYMVRMDDDLADAEFISLADGTSTGSIPASSTGATTWYPGAFSSPDGEWIVLLGEGTDGIETISVLPAHEPSAVGTARLADVEAAIGVSLPRNGPLAVRPGPGGDELLVILQDRDGSAHAARLTFPDLVPVAGPLADVPVGARPVVLDDGRIVAGSGQGSDDIQILPADLASPGVAVDGTNSLTPYAVADGRVVLGGQSGELAVLDPDTADIRRLDDIEGFVTDAAVSPDGTTIAAATIDGGVQLVDVRTGRSLGVPLPAGTSSIVARPAVRWSDDGHGVWYSAGGPPVLLAADPAAWPAAACAIVHRDLTAEEWERYVEPGTSPVAACAAS